MLGPYPKKHDPTRATERDGLVAGVRYRVICEFTDFDGAVHPVGEEWTYLGSHYVPYHDGLTVYVSLDDAHEWVMRMETPGRQEHVAEHWEAYVERIALARAT